MTRKPWPASNSEFLLTSAQIRVLQVSAANPWAGEWEREAWRDMLTHHELVRDINEVHLKLLHDRYCTAAGFRE